MAVHRQRRWLKSSQGRRGAVLVLAAACLIVIFGFVAFTVDVGYLTLTRTQLQSAVDAAALAAAQELLSGDDAASRVREAADELARLNPVLDGRQILDPERDIEIGRWDYDNHTFTPLFGDELKNADAVRITAGFSEERGSPLRLFFAPVIGHRQAEVMVSAIATVGQERARDIVMVLDLSGSMADNNRIEYTREAAAALADEMMPRDRLGLAVYSYPRRQPKNILEQLLMWDSTDITGYLEKPLSFNASDVRSRIPQLRAGMYANRTNIAGGMRAGLDQLRANRRDDPREEELVEKYLVLMTDGHANVAEPPSTSPTQSIEYYANVAASENVIIHGITLGADADKVWVRKAAEITGGDYYHFEDGDFNGLFEAYRNIGRGNRKSKLVE